MKTIITQPRVGRILALFALLSVLGPAARAQYARADAFGPSGGISVGLSYGLLEDILSPLLTAGMAAMDSDMRLVSPIIPIVIKSALGDSCFSLDLGAKIKPQWLHHSNEEYFFLGIEPSLGLSWSSIGVFDNGPVFSAAAYGYWVLLHGERMLLSYGTRAGLGWGWSSGVNGTGYVGIHSYLPWMREEDEYGTVSYERPSLPLPDLVVSWGWRL